jgi:uncharacterized membrane protein
MSDRVSGRPRRVSVTSRIALVLGTLALVAGPGAPIVGAAGTLTITTPYPQVVAEPGSTATFALKLTASPAVTASLSADGVPSGWASRFRGNGTEIGSVYVANATAANAPDVQFSVDVPSDATAGKTTMTLHADGGDLKETLSVTVVVQSSAGGSISLTADSPQRQGTSNATFTFDLTLKNNTPTESTYTWNSQGPDGWTVAVVSSGQSQATNMKVAAGSTGTLTATVTPPQNVAAGDYPIVVTASGGGKSAEADMQVTITGSYSMTMSTPDQVLSTTANAGTEKDFSITITNTGTDTLTKVTPTGNAPTDWKVTFNPTTVDSIPAGQTTTVTAQITPSKDAIAGDYSITMSATGTGANAASANANEAIRVTVETPQFWWIAGVVLLLATFAGLYWVFRTYGRR